jgi:hypothetical protein
MARTSSQIAVTLSLNDQQAPWRRTWSLLAMMPASRAEQMDAHTMSLLIHALDMSGEMTRDPIDRAYWRTLQLLAVPFLVWVGLNVAFLIMIRNAMRAIVQSLDGRAPR